MFAPRADEVVGKLFAFVLVTADFADPFGPRGFAFLRLRFDVGEVVFVCYGRLVREHLAFRDVGKEEAV